MKHASIHPLGLIAAVAFLMTGSLASAQRDGGHGGGWGGGQHDRSGGGGGGHYDRPSSSHGSYGSVHNVFHEQHVDRVTFDRAPIVHPNIAGHDRPADFHAGDWNHHDLFHGGYRWGYYHYDRHWRDDDFRFGFYFFVPVGAFVCSPWYYYPALPPYIAEDRVIVVNDSQPLWNSGEAGWQSYRWEVPGQGGGSYTDLDYALQDIADAFQSQSPTAIDSLCPRTGRVAIYTDGRYSYSLSASDFYDLFRDGTNGARTSRYQILDVRTNGHDIANVLAEQDYTDPWGKPVTVYQTFRLQQEGRNVVIRSFGTSQDRP